MTKIDGKGGRVSQIELKFLSLGLKFSTGLNDQTPLHIARAVNSFKSRYKHDPRVPDISFIRASVIPHLETERHATLPERYIKAFRSLIAKKDIMILPADKGGAVGVLRTTRYHALGLDQLQDTNTFQPVDEDDVIGRDVTAMQQSHNSGIKAVLTQVEDENQ